MVAAAVAVGGLWLRHREVADGESRRILRDIKMLKSLPEGSAAKLALDASIGESIVTMLTNRSLKKRNGMNIGIGLFFIAATGGLALLGSRGGWWWLVSPIMVLTFALGLYGTIEGSKKAERDARGNVVSPTGDRDRSRKAQRHGGTR